MVAQHHTKTPYVGFPFNFSSCTIDANKTINTPAKKNTFLSHWSDG